MAPRSFPIPRRCACIDVVARQIPLAPTLAGMLRLGIVSIEANVWDRRLTMILRMMEICPPGICALRARVLPWTAHFGVLCKTKRFLWYGSSYLLLPTACARTVRLGYWLRFFVTCQAVVLVTRQFFVVLSSYCVVLASFFIARSAFGVALPYFSVVLASCFVVLSSPFSTVLSNV